MPANSSNSTTSKATVFLVCSGLGHINRGYESFTRECFDTLKGSEKFNLFLIGGGGKSVDNEIILPNLPRRGKFTVWLSKILRSEPYTVEQVTFCVSLLLLIIKKKPQIIYYSDFKLGTYLWHLRKHLKFKYKLLFSNGAPNGPPYKTEDHVQQLLPMYIRNAQAGGTPLSKQTLLPYAIAMNVAENLKNTQKKDVLKSTLQLPAHKKVIICVGAINSHHKRIDYLINEFAGLDSAKYFLVVLGQIDELSKPILELADSKLTPGSFIIKQVASHEVNDYLYAADYFILPSLNEGLPRVLPEALSTGLLPMVHNYDVTRETLNSYGVFRDMKTSGILQSAIDEVDSRNISKEELINYAFNEYSWQSLAARYEQMLVDNLA